MPKTLVKKMDCSAFAHYIYGFSGRLGGLRLRLEILRLKK